MQFHPLGDQAVMAYAADEDTAARWAERVRQAAFPWMTDVVQAYRSVAVFYDLALIDYFHALESLTSLESETTLAPAGPGRIFEIPCCYDLGLDWRRLEQQTGLSKEEIVGLHVGTVYRVYAIGFCPGFPYLGYLPDRIAGVPRLESPRLRVEAGSVGLTGRQTGIYTEERPGGWNIVGRTPLELVNVRAGYFPLRTGDRVQFRPINERKYRTLAGKRLDDEATR